MKSLGGRRGSTYRVGERRWIPDLDEHGPREAWVPATVSEMNVSPRKRTDGRTASSVRFRAEDGRDLLFDSQKAKMCWI